MMLVRKVLWVLAFGLGINNVLAQTGKISGRVVDGNTGEPLPGANVVIVEEFLKQGGIVRLVEEKNRVRFEINVTAARRAGLQLSARLLRLARIYEGAG